MAGEALANNTDITDITDNTITGLMENKTITDQMENKTITGIMENYTITDIMEEDMQFSNEKGRSIYRVISWELGKLQTSSKSKKKKKRNDSSIKSQSDLANDDLSPDQRDIILKHEDISDNDDDSDPENLHSAFSPVDGEAIGEIGSLNLEYQDPASVKSKRKPKKKQKKKASKQRREIGRNFFEEMEGNVIYTEGNENKTISELRDIRESEIISHIPEVPTLLDLCLKCIRQNNKISKLFNSSNPQKQFIPKMVELFVSHRNLMKQLGETQIKWCHDIMSATHNPDSYRHDSSNVPFFYPIATVKCYFLNNDGPNSFYTCLPEMPLFEPYVIFTAFQHWLDLRISPHLNYIISLEKSSIPGATFSENLYFGNILYLERWLNHNLPHIYATTENNCIDSVNYKLELSRWLAYVWWARGNLRGATETFLTVLNDAQSSDQDKVLIYNELGRMYNMFGYRLKSSQYYERAQECLLKLVSINNPKYDRQFLQALQSFQDSNFALPLIKLSALHLQCLSLNSGNIDDEVSMNSDKLWNQVFSRHPIPFTMALESIRTKMFYFSGRPHGNLAEMTARYWIESVYLFLSGMIDHSPNTKSDFLRSLFLALRLNQNESMLAFDHFLLSFDENRDLFGLTAIFGDLLVDPDRPHAAIHPWQSLMDMIRAIGHVPLLRMDWRFVPGIPQIKEFTNKSIDRDRHLPNTETISQFSQHFSKSPNLRLTPNGDLTGDFYFDSPPCRSMIIDIRAGKLKFLQTPLPTLPWIDPPSVYFPLENGAQQTLLHLPIPVQLYSCATHRVVIVINNSPTLHHVKYNKISTELFTKSVILHWYGEMGQHSTLNLKKLFKDTKKDALFQNIPKDDEKLIKAKNELLQDWNQNNGVMNSTTFDENDKVRMYNEDCQRVYKKDHTKLPPEKQVKKSRIVRTRNTSALRFRMELVDYYLYGKCTLILLFSPDYNKTHCLDLPRIRTNAVIVVNLESLDTFHTPQCYVIRGFGRYVPLCPSILDLDYAKHFPFISNTVLRMEEYEYLDKVKNDSFICIFLNQMGVQEIPSKRIPYERMQPFFNDSHNLSFIPASIGSFIYIDIPTWQNLYMISTDGSIMKVSYNFSHPRIGYAKLLPGCLMVQTDIMLYFLHPFKLQPYVIHSGSREISQETSSDSTNNHINIRAGSEVRVLLYEFNYKDVISYPPLNLETVSKMPQTAATVGGNNNNEQILSQEIQQGIKKELVDFLPESVQLLENDSKMTGELPKGRFVMTVNNRLLVFSTESKFPYKDDFLSIFLDILVPGEVVETAFVNFDKIAVCVTQCVSRNFEELYIFSLLTGNLCGLLVGLGPGPHGLKPITLEKSNSPDSGKSISGTKLFLLDGYGGLCCVDVDKPLV